MDKKRKIKCDCGGTLDEKQVKFEGFITEALSCNKCDFVTLTRAQAENYAKLKRLHEIVDSKKKIIKIGNSMGITLPDKLKDFGVKVGNKVRLEAINSNSFIIEIDT